EDLPEQRLLRLAPPVLALPVGAPAEVLELREGAKVALLCLGRLAPPGVPLAPEPLDALLPGSRGADFPVDFIPAVPGSGPPIVRHALSEGRHAAEPCETA